MPDATNYAALVWRVVEAMTESATAYSRIPVALLMHPDDYAVYRDEYSMVFSRKDHGNLMLLGPKGERIDIVAVGREWSRHNVSLTPGLMAVMYCDKFDIEGKPVYSTHYVPLYEAKPDEGEQPVTPEA